MLELIRTLGLIYIITSVGISMILDINYNGLFFKKGSVFKKIFKNTDFNIIGIIVVSIFIILFCFMPLLLHGIYLLLTMKLPKKEKKRKRRNKNT